MKHALLISGYLRSFKQNLENLKIYVLNEHDVDIFIHITKNEETKYNNRDISIDEIYRLLQPKVLIVTDNFKLHSDETVNNVLNQNYKFFLLNEKRKEVEVSEKILYSNVLKFRPDIYLQQPIHLDQITENKIFIPINAKMDVSKLTNPTDKYICDILAYGSAEVMNSYFDFYRQIQSLIIEHGTTANETLLYNYLHKNKIDYEHVDIKYFVILSLCNTIAITGDSASGKTTVSKIIKNLFSSSFILECDRYHKWERGDDKWNDFTHLNPEANYLTKMENDVFDLKIGNNIYQVDYDHKNGKFTDQKIIESKENIVVCGLHTLYLKDHIMNIKIYMDTDDNLRIPWKIKRDIQKRGYTVEKIMNQIKSREKDFDKYILPQRTKADLIINFYTDTPFVLENFTTEFEPKVFLRVGIQQTCDVKKLLENITAEKIEKKDKFWFLHFGEKYNYEQIIQTLVLYIQ